MSKLVEPTVTLPKGVPQRKAKGTSTKSDKEKVTLATVNIANHRLRNTSGKLLQFETPT